MANARVIAVMIDNNTDYVINAAQCKINGTDAGVNDVLINGTDSANIEVVDGEVVVDSDSSSNSDSVQRCRLGNRKRTRRRHNCCKRKRLHRCCYRACCHKQQHYREESYYKISIL